jgi:hypothetical protein
VLLHLLRKQGFRTPLTDEESFLPIGPGFLFFRRQVKAIVKNLNLMPMGLDGMMKKNLNIELNIFSVGNPPYTTAKF